MKWHRDEYLALVAGFEPPAGRQMFCELFGPLVGLEEEWRAQGASEAELDLTAFDWDYVPVVHCGADTGLLDPLDPVVLEDTPEYTVRENEYGMREKLIKRSATIFHPLEYPVKCADDWLRVKPRYRFEERRIRWDLVEAARKARAEDGAVVVANMPGGFDLPRLLMGEEASCLAYYDEPELIRDMLDTAGEMALQTLDRVSDKVQIDQLSVHEDLAGKSGPLVGPSIVREFYRPYYRKVWDMLAAKGARVFSQDSDGNITPVIDAFLECGVTEMLPMEPAAGMDVVALREQYGRKLSFKGGIDKHVLRRGKEAIRRELEYKLQPSMRGGGAVFGLDHRIPNGTPLDAYRYYVQTAREILGLPALDSPGAFGGWARMAF